MADVEDLRAETVYKEYWYFVYRVCLKIVRNEHDAEDMAQETFLIMLEKLPTLAPTGPGEKPKHLTTWLFRTARFQCWKFLKRHKRMCYTDELPDAATNGIWDIPPWSRKKKTSMLTEEETRMQAIRLVAHICRELCKFAP